MSDTVLIAIIATAPALLGILATYMQSRKNAVKIDTVQAKTELVHEAVNGNMTALKEELARAQREIATLKTLLAKK